MDLSTINNCKNEVMKNGLVLENIKKKFQTYDICSLAIKQNGFAIIHSKHIDYILSHEAVKQNSLVLPNIKSIYLTKELYLSAIKNNYDSFKYIKIDFLNKNPSFYKEAIEINYNVFKYFYPSYFNEKDYYELCNIVLRKNGLLIEYVNRHMMYSFEYDDLEKIAVDQNIEALQFVKLSYFNESFVYDKIRKNVFALKYIKNQTKEICLHAIRVNISAFEYIKNKTEDICLEALRINGLLLKYIKNQTEYMCLEAINNNGFALEHVKNQTYELCLQAVMKKGMAIKYIKNKNNMTDELIYTAINNDYNVLNEIPEQTEAMCLIAINANLCAMNYIINQTEKICLEAIKKSIFGLKYVKNYTLPLVKYAIELYGPSVLAYTPDIPSDILLDVVKQNKTILKYIQYCRFTKEIWIEYIKIYPENIINMPLEYLDQDIFLNTINLKPTDFNGDILNDTLIKICPLCDEEKKYYINYKCNKNHFCCLDCSKIHRICYYKCGQYIDITNIYVNN